MASPPPDFAGPFAQSSAAPFAGLPEAARPV